MTTCQDSSASSSRDAQGAVPLQDLEQQAPRTPGTPQSGIDATAASRGTVPGAVKVHAKGKAVGG